MGFSFMLVCLSILPVFGAAKVRLVTRRLLLYSFEMPLAATTKSSKQARCIQFIRQSAVYCVPRWFVGRLLSLIQQPRERANSCLMLLHLLHGYPDRSRWYVAANTLLMLNPLCRHSSTLPSLMSDGEYDLSFEDFTYMPNFRRGIGHAYRSLDCVASSNKTFVSPS